MNIIKIKHGSGVPEGKLQPYELGLSDDDGTLYVGSPDGSVFQLNNHLIHGGIVDGYLQITQGIETSYIFTHGSIISGWYDEYEYEVVCLQPTDIVIDSFYINEETPWDRGLRFCYDGGYLGGIGAIANGESLDYIYVGNNQESWLKIIPDKGIETDGIILKPYNEQTGKGSYGYKNPNDAGISGVEGQLYFVIAE